MTHCFKQVHWSIWYLARSTAWGSQSLHVSFSMLYYRQQDVYYLCLRCQALQLLLLPHPQSWDCFQLHSFLHLHRYRWVHLWRILSWVKFVAQEPPQSDHFVCLWLRRLNQKACRLIMSSRLHSFRYAGRLMDFSWPSCKRGSDHLVDPIWLKCQAS